MTPPNKNTACVCREPNCVIPYGYCHCGCGEFAKVNPARFCSGHSRVRLSPTYFDHASPFKIDGVYCKVIPLTRGLFTIVWESDYAWLAKRKWNALWNWSNQSFYAVSTGGLRMNRVILGLKAGDERIGDHINGGSLDNRQSNLRIASHAQNMKNRRLSSNNTSGRTGVWWLERSHKWQVIIYIDGIRLDLGRHISFEIACWIRGEAEKKYYGEFARLI